jgi:BioD-like phosphotransacetylase family protein
MRDVYKCNNDLHDMSPVAVDRKFTRRYIEDPHHEELEHCIADRFEKVAADKDIVVIEGTGHAGVGAVFDLDNAHVASMLISCGGIGRPFDEIALNRAMFEKHGVNIIGVIVNKVNAHKVDEITHYLDRALDRIGLPLLGVFPHRPRLLDPTIRQVIEAVGGEVLNGEANLQNFVREIIVGAMTPHRALHYFKANSLVVTPGDRDDIVLTAISLASTTRAPRGHMVAGLVLTGGVRPRKSVMRVIQRTNIPVVLSKGDTYLVTSQLHDMMVKIKPGELEKIKLIQRMYSKYFNINRLLEQLA